ncbi:MAG: hypothetical protein M1819_001371 [Sarea resinae]|nr:MAG: hypothetical protein M1819_001371 [Sarea resinae]
MKAIFQRVTSASVTVDKELISSIGKGLLVFAAVAPEDTKDSVEAMAKKVLKVKLWEDDAGGKVRMSGYAVIREIMLTHWKWKRSVQDIQGEVLCVSQFTLLASLKKNKPDFHKAMKGSQAKELYDHFFASVQQIYGEDKVKNGVFQAMMEVGLVNDGPVGLDYRCEDGAVNPASLEPDRGVTDHLYVQVTVEVDTEPPPMKFKDNPIPSFDGLSLEKTLGELGKSKSSRFSGPSTAESGTPGASESGEDKAKYTIPGGKTTFTLPDSLLQ